ncbi:MAG TPA: hypothetical protein ENH22_00510 [Candidatus Campbellbacteria bacterium]|nr:hypothetical protein [Candidatus Campbellbacteria bacterium]
MGIQHAQIDFTMQSASKQSSLGTASFMTFSFGFNAPKYALAYKTPDEISKMKKEELIKQLSRYPFDHELTERFGKSARTVEDIYKDEIAFRLESLALANGDTSLAMHYADFAESLFPLDRKYRKIRGNIYSLKNKQYYNKIGPEVSKDMPPLIKDYQKRSRYFRRKKAPALNYLACLLLGEQFGKQKKEAYQGEIKNLLAEKGVIKFSKIIKTLPPKQKNRLLFLKAVAYERIGEYQNAAKQWQALENTTGYATLALYHESVLYLKAGNYKSADEKLKKLNQIKQYSILDREEMGLFPIQSDNSLRDDYWFLKGYSEFLKKGKTAGDSTERRKIVNNYAEILNFNPASNIGKFLNSPLITGNIFQKFLNYVNTANDAVFTRAFNAYFKAFQNGIMTDITFIENYQSKK